MTHHDPTADDTSDEPGPESNTDDATKSDMGMTGTPAQSATPVGQGDEPGTGADAEPEHHDQDGEGL